MTITVLTAIAVVGLAVGLFIFRAIPGIRAYFDFKGKRLITCPESHTAETVEIAAGEAALGAFLTEPTVHLRECSRWPERQNCGQECLRQIEIDPENCLVWNVVATWYQDKHCAFCDRRITPLRHLDHAPALLAPDRTTVEWRDFEPQKLPQVFETHLPVCWNCHVTETFRRLHPELVVDREVASKKVR